MAETVHTPEPWFVPDQTWARETRIEVEDGIACPGSGGAMSYTTTVCTLGWNSTTPEWEANARLIAAAPDLLEALAPFADQARHHAADAPEWRDSDTVSAVISIGDLRRARAAIARATGEKEAKE